MSAPAMTDRALAQTARAGLTYASVPMPWLLDWMSWVADNGTSFPFLTLCGLPGWAFDGGPEDLDDDGNFNLCLLPAGHDGEHGHPQQGGQQ